MKISRPLLLVAFLWALLSTLPSPAAFAAELKIGYKAEVTSADPHVLNGQNRAVWMHVYESLVGQDAKLRPVPLLATSWKLLDETTWEFKLRSGVFFHDGTPLTADDVKYSIDRAKALVGPRTFRTYLATVDSVSAPDARTVIVKTKAFNPVLPDNVGLIAILPRSLGKDVGEEQFENRKSAIGTGPYRFTAWLHGQRVTLARNDKYWGARPQWDQVSFQFIPKEAARASALLAGSVDLIDGASAALAEAFHRNNKIEMVSTTSYMLNYLQFDHFRSTTPFVTDNDGKPLSKNPFADRRVRQAISLAIDRQAIERQVMKGDAEPAGQLVPKGFFGYDPALKAPVVNQARAKALLAEAGYPEGFRLTLHCPNDRYLNDAKVCEAIGQMLTQVGIKAEVRTLPFAVFVTRSSTGGPGGEPEFSLSLIGTGAVLGDSLQPLISTVETYDKAQGTGANQDCCRYSNKEVDALIRKAQASQDPKQREEAQRAAARMAMDDAAIAPVHHLKAVWAVRKGLTIEPRSDGFTLAANVRDSAAKGK